MAPDPNQKLFSQISDLGRNINSLAESIKKNTVSTELLAAATDKSEKREKESATGSIKASTDKSINDSVTDKQLKDVNKMLSALLGEKTTAKNTRIETTKKESENKAVSEPNEQNKKLAESNNKDFSKVNPKPSKDIVIDKKISAETTAKEIQTKIGLDKKSKPEIQEKESIKPAGEKKALDIFSKIGKGAENAAFGIAGKVAGNFGVDSALTKTGLGILKKSIDNKRNQKTSDDIFKKDASNDDKKEETLKKSSKLSDLKTKLISKISAEPKNSGEGENQKSDKKNGIFSRFKKDKLEEDSAKKETKGASLLSKIGGKAENALFSAAGKTAERLGVASPLAKKGLSVLKGSIDKKGGLGEVLSKREESKADLGKVGKKSEEAQTAKPVKVSTKPPALVNNIKKLSALAKKEAPKETKAAETKAAETKATETESSISSVKSTDNKTGADKKSESSESNKNGLGSDKDIQDIKNALTRMAGLLEGTLTVSVLDQPFRPDSRRI